MELNRLIPDVDKFDLSKKEDLRAFGNKIGRQLEMTEKDEMVIGIRSIQSGKVLFIGELKPIGEGQFELYARSDSER